MKVVAFNGSPNSERNTWHALKMVTAELKRRGARPRSSPWGKNKNEQCMLPGDEVIAWIQKIKEAETASCSVRRCTTPPARER